MGIDTEFFKSLPLDVEDEGFDIGKAWVAFRNQGVAVDEEERGFCWDLIDDELVANNHYRARPDFWIQQLIHICENFLRPNNIMWFPTCIPWTSSWGDHESGVLFVEKNLIKLVTVDMDGNVKVENYPLIFPESPIN